MFPSCAAAADCADSADLGLDTGVTLFMSFLFMSFMPFHFVPVAELLLVPITGEEKKGQSQESCPGAHRLRSIPYFHPAHRFSSVSLAASMTGMKLNLIYPGDGRGSIEHNKLNPKIAKGHWKGKDSARWKS